MTTLHNHFGFTKHQKSKTWKSCCQKWRVFTLVSGHSLFSRGRSLKDVDFNKKRLLKCNQSPVGWSVWIPKLTWMTWSSLLISTASWHCSNAVNKELQALQQQKHKQILYIYILHNLLQFWNWSWSLRLTSVWTELEPLRVLIGLTHYSRPTHCCSPGTSERQRGI